MTLIHGDCIEVMAGMEPESVDAIVTDPPLRRHRRGTAERDTARAGVGRMTAALAVILARKEEAVDDQ